MPIGVCHHRLFSVRRGAVNRQWPEPPEERFERLGVVVVPDIRVLGICAVETDDRITVYLEALTADDAQLTAALDVVAISSKVHKADDLGDYSYAGGVTIGDRRAHVFYRLRKES